MIPSLLTQIFATLQSFQCSKSSTIKETHLGLVTINTTSCNTKKRCIVSLIILCVVVNAVSRTPVIAETWVRSHVGCVVDEVALEKEVLLSSPVITIPAGLFTNYSCIIHAVRS